MRVSKQGDTYEEDGELTDNTGEAEEEVSQKITAIYGIPIKMLVPIAIGVLILVFAVVGLTFTSGGERYDATDGSGEFEMTFDDSSMLEDPWATSETVVDPWAASETVTDPWATSGDAVDLWAVSDTTTTVDTNDYALLRKYGYSADEIDTAYAWGFDIDQLVEDAKALQDEAAKEALQRMSDTAGEEYKHLLDVTYMGQPEITVDDQRLVAAEEIVSEITEVVINADYVKCEPRGVQLQLKCKISENEYYWYTIEPRRWVTLPDRGNIVLRLKIHQYGDDRYVIAASEDNSNLDTVPGADGNTTTPTTAEEVAE